MNKAKSRHHGRSPRRCHACYGIDKTRSDINTVASVQSNYAAWPVSIPASHAVLCWRPCIQPALEMRLALFIFKPSLTLVSSPLQAPSLCPQPYAQPYNPALSRPLDRVLPQALKKPQREDKIPCELPSGSRLAMKMKSY